MVPCFFNKLLYKWASCGLVRPEVGTGICFHTFYIFSTYFLQRSTYGTYFLHTLYIIYGIFYICTYFLQLKKPFLKLGPEPQHFHGSGSSCAKKGAAPAPQPW